MISGSVYDYYSFGYNYCLLITQGKSNTYKTLVNNIEMYIDLAEQLSLKVTNSIAKSELTEIKNDFLLKPQGEKVSEEDFSNLLKILKEADTTLDNELQLKQIFQMSIKKLDNEKLYSNGREFLSIDAQKNISRQASVDFRYGCRCISLQVSTAAAFHLMRSVEQCVKELYYSYFRTNRLPTDKQMWGNMTNALKTRTKGKKPSITLIENLDMFRRNYRNPTQHPDKNYNIEEAQNLLFSVIVLMSEIFNDPIIKKYSHIHR